jgi:beta-alanine degradation protein BauB
MTNRRSGRKTFMIGAVAFVLGAGAMWAQQQATTRREPQFDNTRLKVWKSIIYPNQPLSLHRHDHGRALIALTDGVLDVVDPSGKRINQYHWQAGKAYWLDKDPPNTTHADVNNSGKVIEVVVVELKNDP